MSKKDIDGARKIQERKGLKRFSIYLSIGKKFEKETERENLPSLSKKDTLKNDFPYIYRCKYSIYLSSKNLTKRQRGKIYHPCRRKTLMEQKKFDRKERIGTIFHIFIDRKKIRKREREDLPFIFVLPWRMIFHIFIDGEKIEKKTERKNLPSLLKKDTLENDFPYIYSVKKF